jgi:hypothetical protein
MCLLGQVRDGVYINDYDNVRPTVLERYYGVHGHPVQRESGLTGAGQLNDEYISQPPSPREGDTSDSSDDSDNLEARIEAAHADNFHHDAVTVPKHASPFDDDETEQLFAILLLLLTKMR